MPKLDYLRVVLEAIEELAETLKFENQIMMFCLMTIAWSILFDEAEELASRFQELELVMDPFPIPSNKVDRELFNKLLPIIRRTDSMNGNLPGIQYCLTALTVMLATDELEIAQHLCFVYHRTMINKMAIALGCYNPMRMKPVGRLKG